ncbi:predicted protein [Botrytis cinerea T4]|uniref:Uncharacterized protein n=1 Tax=Botryotinia fuckeliana (strain T4) TaxID=999810 RepID=G2YST3_BOTF4|nr:predicted protein [Botrytis cinerea T4]
MNLFGEAAARTAASESCSPKSHLLVVSAGCVRVVFVDIRYTRHSSINLRNPSLGRHSYQDQQGG